ncbi:MAG: cyclic pyranopterin monophosphate synthase MoaC [Thermoleophilia bacterium]|nr:cyclic pyranopterin monophosphate synthase MoaC [Thermoleophilia bacterium]MDH3724914.1 cyclic pyranopterin monophosphate synthase MoaC [Thermoleophilia bacterium]
MSEEPLTHLTPRGEAHMVDVSAKVPVRRRAIAAGRVRAAPRTIAAMLDGTTPKGDVAALARVAGITAAKRASELIPLCHPLPLEKVSVEVSASAEDGRVTITAEVVTTAKTGVEMEALSAVSGAALTIYDMLKAIDSGLAIEEIALIEKTKG